MGYQRQKVRCLPLTNTVESFVSRAPIQTWEKHKLAIEQGKRPAYDLKRFEALQQAEYEKAARKEQKQTVQDSEDASDQHSSPELHKSKRRKLVRKIDTSKRHVTSRSSSSNSSDSSEEDEPLITRRAQKGIFKGAAITRAKPKAQLPIPDVEFSLSQTSLFNDSPSSPHVASTSRTNRVSTPHNALPAVGKRKIADVNIKPTGQPTKTIDHNTKSVQPKKATATRTAPSYGLHDIPKSKGNTRMISAPSVPKPAVKSASSTTAPGLFKKIAEQHRYNKAGINRERAPDMSTLQLRSISDSDPAPLASTTATTTSIAHMRITSAPVAAKAPTDTLRPQPPRKISDTSLVNLPPIGPAIAKSTPAASGLATAVIPNIPQGSMKSGVLTCPYWARGDCQRGNACFDAHEHGHPMRPKFDDTCDWWRAGRCNFDAKHCTRHHAEKDASGAYTITNPKPSSEVASTHKSITHPPDHSRPSVPDRAVQANTTCRYWYRGTCKNTDRDCPAMHSRSSYIKPKIKGVCQLWASVNRCMWPDVKCERYHQHFDSQGQPTRAMKWVTCKKWLAGDCTLGQEHCDKWHAIFDARVPPELREEDMTQVGAQVDTDPHADDEDYHICPGKLIPTNPITNEQSVSIDIIAQFLSGYNSVAHLDTVRKDFTLRPKHYCSAFELSIVLKDAIDRPIATGRLFCNEQAVRVCTALSEYLCAARTLMFDGNYCIVMLQAQEAWSMHGTLAPLPARVFPADLCFEIYELDRTIKISKSLEPKTDTTSAACEQAFKELTADRLFAGNTENRIVFIMFPAHLVQETQILALYLSTLKATVYCADEAGSWQAFRDEYARLRPPAAAVLYHPLLNQYKDFPELRSLLNDGNCFHFELHTDHDPAVFSCTRLFPSSQALMITDHVLQYQPEKALKLIEVFTDDQRSKDGVLRNDQLVLRPGVSDFLLELLEDEDDPARAATYEKLAISIVRLYDEEMPQQAKFRSPAMVTLPIAGASQYADMWSRDEAQASAWLVEWFAGWAYLQREKLRRFVVIHASPPAEARPDRTPSSATPQDEQRREWNARYMHLTVIEAAKYIAGRRPTKR